MQFSFSGSKQLECKKAWIQCECEKLEHINSTAKFFTGIGELGDEAATVVHKNSYNLRAKSLDISTAKFFTNWRIG
jgi:hypothetical protein